VESLAVYIAIHLRVGEEDLRRTALGDDLQHAGFLKLFDGLRSKDHGGVVLAPGFLSRNNIAADGLVLDEKPCLIEQEYFECGESCGIGDFVRCPVQNVKQQRLQNVGRIAPAGEVEGLEAAERKRVLSVVEKESVLAAARPAVQALLQLADDVGEVGERSPGHKCARSHPTASAPP